MHNSSKYENSISLYVSKSLEKEIKDLIIDLKDAVKTEKITLEVISELQKEFLHAYELLTKLKDNFNYHSIFDLDNALLNLKNCLRILNKHINESRKEPDVE